jgi:hypothetical protein
LNIRRTLILGSEFKREVDAIRDVFPDAPIARFVTDGEIARFSGRLGRVPRHHRRRRHAARLIADRMARLMLLGPIWAATT